MAAAKDRLPREGIAMRVAKELPDGAVVNLGIGIPTLTSQFVPEGRQVIYQSENGVLGYGPLAEPGQEDIDLINAGGQFLKRVPGMSFFNSARAFDMIRGGHVDITILGALQVSQKGDLANWMIPARGIGNIGGGMDLAAGARKVIVAMEHTDKSGRPKIVHQCSYPLTGRECVSLIVTDLAVIEVINGGNRGASPPQGLLLREVAPGWTPQEVQALTEPTLLIAPDLKEIEL
ncbi:MAG: 3-oxoacid CoA-transferase subunit B [Chloroflexi bacterium]|nr:3-oxoacid CoA-transferase subunit B [Chloroflexota bacterium]